VGLIVIVLQVVGLLLVAAGGWMLAPWLGLVLAGVGCVLLGLALER
jgi:hypothetical protein